MLLKDIMDGGTARLRRRYGSRRHTTGYHGRLRLVLRLDRCRGDGRREEEGAGGDRPNQGGRGGDGEGTRRYHPEADRRGRPEDEGGEAGLRVGDDRPPAGCPRDLPRRGRE